MKFFLTLLLITTSPIIQAQTHNVVGGEKSSTTNYPWSVSLGQDLRSINKGISHFCGGSIISKRFILTAAHCAISLTDKNPKFPISIRAGGDGERKNLISLGSHEEVFLHDFDMNKALGHDIALIKLSKPIKFGRNIKPIFLPNPRKKIHQLISSNPKKISYAAWGNTKWLGNYKASDVLNELELYTLPLKGSKFWERKRHRELYFTTNYGDWAWNYFNSGEYIPYSTLKEKQGFGGGDSGSGIVKKFTKHYYIYNKLAPLSWINYKKKPVLLGLVNAGTGATDPDDPKKLIEGAFLGANIHSYMKWILKTIRNNSH